MNTEQIAAEIAKAIAPLFADSRRALMHELEQIKAPATGMNAPLTKRQLFQFLGNPGRAVRATENGYFY